MVLDSPQYRHRWPSTMHSRRLQLRSGLGLGLLLPARTPQVGLETAPAECASDTARPPTPPPAIRGAGKGERRARGLWESTALGSFNRGAGRGGTGSKYVEPPCGVQLMAPHGWGNPAAGRVVLDNAPPALYSPWREPGRGTHRSQDARLDRRSRLRMALPAWHCGRYGTQSAAGRRSDM